MSCFVNGCNQAGGIQFGGQWICRYHHGVNPNKWGAVTLALKTLREEVLLLNEYDRLCFVDLQKRDKDTGTKNVPKNEPIFQYVETLRAYVVGQIRGKV